MATTGTQTQTTDEVIKPTNNELIDFIHAVHELL